MTGMLRVIMNASGILEFGVCRFDAVAEKFYDCLARGRLPKQPKSVLTAAFPYYTGCGQEDTCAALTDFYEIAGHMLAVASDVLHKAFGDDYEFVWFTDSSPVPEVYSASVSGLGKIGDNGLLIHPRYGNYVFLGSIVTNLDLPATGDKPDFCDHCGSCRAACPGNAFEKKEEDEKEAFSHEGCAGHGAQNAAQVCVPRHGGLMWGCNACQQACPHNKGAEETPIASFLDRMRPDRPANDLTSANPLAYLSRSLNPIEHKLASEELEVSS